ncbi:MAG: M20/M25/M40 family metallo-hydrolase [Bryobacteraceae bacterium]|nr:M20/M25/M40 family metallo-hydrolase [Bryobacteraceae bacterium]
MRFGFVFLAAALWAQSPKQLHPTVEKVAAAVSTERIAATLQKLESFGTRDIHSTQIHEATAWIEQEFKSMSPRLQVTLDKHLAKKRGRMMRDVEVTNVVAVLPGKTQPAVHVLITAHYDSVVLVRKPAVGNAPAAIDNAASAAAPKAPGVSDDASGVAAVMELARVMSQHEFDKTVVFIAFSGEEYGLLGALGYATAAKKAGMKIEAVLNNDIIGNDDNGQGLKVSNVVRVFSEDPADSPSRAIARYVRDTGERYIPGMKVDAVFRNDRFGRGGDHTAFNNNGYPGVRLTTVAEDLKKQHSPDDTFANASPSYCAQVARVNGAALASLALAPAPPMVTRDVTRTEAETGYSVQPNLARGKESVDAVLKWKMGTEPDLAGYAVVVRSTTSPFWERETYVGKVSEFTLKNLSIDDAVIGVKAIDKDGVESIVSAYVLPKRNFAPVN